MTFNDFYTEAVKTVGGDNKSRRTWFDALNKRGVGVVSINKMSQVADKTFTRLGRQLPAEAIQKVRV